MSWGPRGVSRERGEATCTEKGNWARPVDTGPQPRICSDGPSSACLSPHQPAQVGFRKAATRAAPLRSSALYIRTSGLCPRRPHKTPADSADTVLTDEGLRLRWMKGPAHGHPAGEGQRRGPKPGRLPPGPVLIPTILWKSGSNPGMLPLNLSQQLHAENLG